MEHLRIYDRGDPPKLIAEHPDVVAKVVTGTGALRLDLAGSRVSRVVYAPGWWGVVEEIAPADEPEPEPQLVEPAEIDMRPTPASDPITQILPVVAGPEAGPDTITDAELTSFMAELTDRDRVHAAMQIPCICDELRCPVVTNPATAAEKRFWRKRQQTGTRGDSAPAEVEPLKRCVFMVGHNVAEQDHGWIAGGWPFGPGDHHPECTRHPERYNGARPVHAPSEEGQSPMVAGITPSEATGELSATGDVSQTSAVSTLTTPMGRHQADVDPEAAGLLYDRHAPAETALCPVMAPAGLWPFTGFLPEHLQCDHVAGHIGNLHGHTLPDGTRLSWLT
jgi:hypothetical protein